MLSTLALYLPQFHRVPENDRWWGEGFTEWTAVKGAEVLYDGHNQPRVPLNQNYYNLLEYETMDWQSRLMQKYHIDGMCFYHYWFGNGKRILEKPAENLLKWTDISMPFCFCWANQTWSRTWKKLVDTTAWTSVYEPKNDFNTNGILIQQVYGREKEWEEHFEYLLSFFYDKRYIKLDGRPVFVIYRPEDILALDSMMNYFNTRAKENGFPGIYVIGMERAISEKLDKKALDAICIRQPDFAIITHFNKLTSPSQALAIYSYDDMWEKILNQKIQKEKTYLCGVVDYDTSPRAGNSGASMKDVSPEKFYKYFKKLYKRSLQLDNEFIFINAWNEWGEGMYLEPDEKNGYKYLEVLSKAIKESKDEFLSEGKKDIEDLYETDLKEEMKNVNECIKALSRHDSLLNDWLCLKEKNINFSAYFKKYDYENIAIYGMGKLGIHLLKELDKGDIKVLYGIDKANKDDMKRIKVYNPNQKLPNVDAVVITIIGQYREIREMLSEKLLCPMITIEEILQELMFE